MERGKTASLADVVQRCVVSHNTDINTLFSVNNIRDSGYDIAVLYSLYSATMAIHAMPPAVYLSWLSNPKAKGPATRCDEMSHFLAILSI